MATSYSMQPANDKRESTHNDPPDDTPDDTNIELNEYSQEHNEKPDLDSNEDMGEETNGYQRGVMAIQNAVAECWGRHGRVVKAVVLIVIAMLYATFLIYACVYDFDRAQALLYISIAVLVYVAYAFLRERVGKAMAPCWIVFVKYALTRPVKCVVYILVVILILSLTIYFTYEEPERLMSGFGLLVFVFLTFVFSNNPAKVDWRPVLWGLLIQYIFGVFILRTTVGFLIFEFLGDQIQIFLGYTNTGTVFVFGELITENESFVLSVLSIIIFFSSVISILYHLGAMQFLIMKISWLMQHTLGTSGAESLSAAGNIFVGMTEAPLLVRPFVEDMTMSELHAVMTGGFATIAGSVLAIYISFGINASHLLTASVMSAPAALAFSKLFYPETKVSKTRDINSIQIDRGTDMNVIEAAASGALTAIPLVLNITAMLIAFLSILAFINSILAWLGAMVGIGDLTFELICSYLFTPLAVLMGVPFADTMKVAQLVGTKTFMNEFIAYESLAKMITNGELSDRSQVIATYALCGFSNLGSIGIVLGGIGAIAPSRRSDLARLSIRTLICGSVACFSTACIAGLLYDDTLLQSASANTTLASIINTTIV